MALRYGNRQQTTLLPQSIEEYIAADDPVRAYDSMIKAFSFYDLGIDESCNKVGNAKYDPRSMLKLLVYGYSYGIRSSRKLERACHHNMSFIWLVGGLKPDHKTIANFRRQHINSIKLVLKQCARICMKLNLMDGNILFVDGTKMRANVSKNSILSQKQVKIDLAKIEQRIDVLLAECEKIDGNESNNGSYVKMQAELHAQEKLQSKIQSAMEEFDKQDKKHISSTDKDSIMVKNSTGYFMGYNSQSVTDDKHGLIVHNEIVDEPTDFRQLDQQISQANENVNQKCKTAVADAGYFSYEVMQKLSKKGVEILVPDSQKKRREKDDFNRKGFKYNKSKDCYYCPEGRELRMIKEEVDKKRKSYRITKRSYCKECKHRTKCTNSIQGRSIRRSEYHESTNEIRKNFESKRSQKIFSRRKYRAEHPFAYFKQNLGYNKFVLNGRNKVSAEFAIMSLAYNIRRIITIVGTSNLVASLA